MEERYWLRHPSLQGLLGPYGEIELRAALATHSFPDDSYVLPDRGQDETALRASPYWRPITDVLNLPRPPGPPALPPPLPGPTEQAAQRRRELRYRTAYSWQRTLTTATAIFGITLVCLTASAALAAFGREGGAIATAVLVGEFAWQILVIVVAAAALQALFDLADSAQSRSEGASPPSSARPPA